MRGSRIERNASVLACVALLGCKSKGRTTVDSGPPVAAVTVTSVDASADASAQGSPATVARDARAFVASSGSRYAVVAADGSSWRVDAISRAGEATTLGTETRYADHVAVVPDEDGALVAWTLLDQRFGGVSRFARGSDPTMLIDGEAFKAIFTSVVVADDYVFAASPLVRFHRPSGKAKALGIDDVVRLAAADGTLFIAEQKAAVSLTEYRSRWTIRATPYATTRFSDVAKGEGTVYGLAASADGVAWSTIDSAMFPAPDTATGSVWFRPKKGVPVRLAKDLASPMGLTLDGAYVYVALRGGRDDAPSKGSIVRLPLAGGAPEIIAADIGAPIDVAVDDAQVYTIAESRVQMSAPYYATLTFVSNPSDVLVFAKPPPK